MNRKNLKKISISLITVVALFAVVFTSLADAAYWGGGRANNAKPKAFYHSSVANNGFTSHYDKGRAYWNAHSKVNITKSSTSSGADRYYIGNTSTRGLLGRMTPYKANGTTAALADYWGHTEVMMYGNQMKASSNYSNGAVNYNAAHEIGHSIKMAHVSIPTNSVMVQGFRTNPSSLTSFDRGEVDKKW